VRGQHSLVRSRTAHVEYLCTQLQLSPAHKGLYGGHPHMMPDEMLSVVHTTDMQPLEGLARGVQPAVEVVAAEMETVLYAQMLALFAPQVRNAPRCTASLDILTAP
jgi:hypothetical protein